MELEWACEIARRSSREPFEQRLAQFWTAPHPEPPHRRRGEGAESRLYSVPLPYVTLGDFPFPTNTPGSTPKASARRSM
jgi:hypothetical protein